ncbi:TetR/AcrR family transcriptional regulator [Paenibacillus sp. P26]|nr:TetR/AcrR family transcriptional regulator [Paenibacillus sp. P26]
MDDKQKKNAAGRPRSKEAWEAVLAAAQTPLGTTGYRNLTMEGIAKAAGVGKPTLYRWWPNVPSIVMEVQRRYAETQIGDPDTGSLSSDLLQFIGKTCSSLNGQSGDIMRCLMAEAQLNPDFAKDFRETFIASRRSRADRHPSARHPSGELRRNSDLELLADLVYGPIWYRSLNRHALLDEHFVRSLTDEPLAHGE